MAKISYGWPKKEHECAFFQNDGIKNEKQIGARINGQVLLDTWPFILASMSVEA